MHAISSRRCSTPCGARDDQDDSRSLEDLKVLMATAAAVTATAPRLNNVTFMEMFIKELTPSDVGKLNRLVIPKKHATQYFPQVASETAQVLVEFVDREARRWTFRYCYWKSSQSYVLTKGWNKFVKEKKLQAKDAVAFYRCQEWEGLQRTYCLIDVIRCNDGGQCDSTVNKSAPTSTDLKRKIEQIRDEEEKPSVLSLERRPEKSVKLFGVHIS